MCQVKFPKCHDYRGVYIILYLPYDKKITKESLKISIEILFKNLYEK